MTIRTSQGVGPGRRKAPHVNSPESSHPMKSTAQAKHGPRGNFKHAFNGRNTDRAMLSEIAYRALAERGLEPEFPLRALQELASIHKPAHEVEDVRDMRDRLWASIDNDDSRDLDQLTVAESLDGGRVRILVAVADVGALVPKDSAIDDHAACNTTSAYTPAVMFPMLPLPLSFDLTSLNEGEDRIAVVTDMVFEAEGALVTADHYRANVRNHAKLAYRSMGLWLAGDGPVPGANPEGARPRRQPPSSRRHRPVAGKFARTPRRTQSCDH